jgi:hypothetical protein
MNKGQAMQQLVMRKLLGALVSVSQHLVQVRQTLLLL